MAEIKEVGILGSGIMGAGLAEVAPRFDAALVDVWGVVHNGRAPYMAAVDACRHFQAERGPVVLVSNSPRPSTR